MDKKEIQLFKPLKASYKAGNLLQLIDSEELAKIHYKCSEFIKENKIPADWCPPLELLNTLKDVIFYVESVMFFHFGIPLYILNFQLDDKNHTIRLCESCLEKTDKLVSGYYTLTWDLVNTKNKNTLYVSHYFFALNTGEELRFYYNPQFFWDKIPLTAINDFVIKNLERECAVFNNFDEEQNAPDKIDYLKGWKKSKTIDPYMPLVGNYYKHPPIRFISRNNRIDVFYKMGDYIEPLQQKNIKKMTVDDVNILLNLAVRTQTFRKYNDIKDLDCFKKNSKIKRILNWFY